MTPEEQEEHRRRWVCSTKKPFPSRAAARKARRDQRGLGRTGLVVYPCRFCGLWHLGHEFGQGTGIRPGRPFG